MIQLEFPIGFILNEHFIPAHLLFEILAFWIGGAYYYKIRKQQKDIFTASQRLTLLLSAAIGALLGSRLLAAIEHYELLANDFSWILFTQSKTIVGGIIGGWIAVEIAKKILKIKKSSGDLFTFPLILGIMIGRIGCALTGVSDGTAGIASNLPWAFDQGDGIARHPTAIYEMLFLGILWIILSFLKRNYTLKNGDIFKFFMIGYSLWRLLVEFIKPVPDLLWELSAIQIACVCVLGYYGHIFTKRFYKLT
ncbi:prolipoprotein diacylglyceryl transferase [Candidatus Peregrinibacteria bacterium]|nr:MAG: prolipoprotein diacylglyceryl transferase [Candidatus Peregrinibacteria bacterium]